MNELTVILVLTISICVLLPSFVVWMVSRRKMYQAKKRTEIALAYLQQNPHADIEDLVKKITPVTDPRLRLLPFLCIGLIFGIISIAFVVLLSVADFASVQGFVFVCFLTGLSLVISIPSIVCYIVGRRSFRK